MVNITIKEQFEVLIARMEAHPNVARGVRTFGQTKATIDNVWKAISEDLNCYGPPKRIPNEWQKVANIFFWVHDMYVCIINTSDNTLELSFQ